MSKHTPGPWYCIVRPTANLYEVFGEGSDHASIDTRSANARLIETAPELAEALRKFLDARSDRHGHTTMPIAEAAARAALAKAGL